MSLPAGKLNKRVQLQAPTRAPGETGELEAAWTTYATVWAAFRTLSGAERTAAQQVGATLTHEVTVRRRADIKPTHRLLYGARTFDIKDARNVDEGNEQIRMRCVEVVA